MKTDEKLITVITIDHACCKGCHLCIDQCPNEVLEISETRNEKGYRMPEVARIEECTGCLMCEMICPDMSIMVEVK